MRNETAQIMEHSSQLEAKSIELSRTARQLREANEKIMRVSEQKDDFLSQVSHELRTPMTSIRAFSEILRDSERLSNKEKKKYSNIIHGEAVRLTRLLDDLLDLNVLENRQISLNLQHSKLNSIIDSAIGSATASDHELLKIIRNPNEEAVDVFTDIDRLSQVFINLIRNAQKYCDAAAPELRIQVSENETSVVIDFIDNGAGIPRNSQEAIFEKFAQVRENHAGGTGLGLAICREIMARLGGEVTYLPGQGGAAFRVLLPASQRMAAQ